MVPVILTRTQGVHAFFCRSLFRRDFIEARLTGQAHMSPG